MKKFLWCKEYLHFNCYTGKLNKMLKYAAWKIFCLFSFFNLINDKFLCPFYSWTKWCLESWDRQVFLPFLPLSVFLYCAWSKYYQLVFFRVGGKILNSSTLPRLRRRASDKSTWRGFWTEQRWRQCTVASVVDPNKHYFGSVLWIRIGFSADPDPAFNLSADRDSTRIQEAKTMRI